MYALHWVDFLILYYQCVPAYICNVAVENGWLSDRYCIGTDTGRIVSNRIGYCCIGRYYVHHCWFINCWWIALHTMIKGRSSDPSPALRARTRACCFIWSLIRDRVGGEGGGRRLKPDTGIPVTQRLRSAGLGHHHAALPPPAGSDNNSQLSITLTFLQVNQQRRSNRPPAGGGPARKGGPKSSNARKFQV